MALIGGGNSGGGGGGGFSYMEPWELANLQAQMNLTSPTQRHAMDLEKGDRAYSQGKFDDLLGYMKGGFGSLGSAQGGFGGMQGIEGRLADLLDRPETIKETGAYKWRLGQGQQALERSLGAKGLLGSGNRLTELSKYGQDMASQEYENQFGRLSSLLGNYGQTQASMFGSLANVLGSGAIGAGGGRDAWGAYGAEQGAAGQSAQAGAARYESDNKLKAAQMDANARIIAATLAARAKGGF